MNSIDIAIDEFVLFSKAVRDSGPDGGFSEITREFVEGFLRNIVEEGENSLSVEVIRDHCAGFSEGRIFDGQRWLFSVIQDWLGYTASQELLKRYSTPGFAGLDHLIPGHGVGETT